MQIPKFITVLHDGKKTYLSPQADGLKECCPDTRLNGESTLEFQLPATSPKLSALTPECEIHAGGRVYNLLRKEAIDIVRDESNKRWARFMAEERWNELDSEYPEPYISNDPTISSPADLTVIIVAGGDDLSDGLYPVGSAAHALYAVLDGSGWTLGTVDVPGIHDVEMEKVSRLALIREIQNKWGGYIVWDSENKTVSLRCGNEWQPYTGFQIRYAKNLKHITRTQSNRLITKLYAFGHDDLDIASVNNGKKYLTNISFTPREFTAIYKNQDIYDPQELKDKATAELELVCRPRYLYRVKIADLRTLPEYSHEEFTVGDMADIVDPDIAPDSPRPRIIRHKYNLFMPWVCEIEIGDPLERIQEQLKAAFGITGFIDGKFTEGGRFSGRSIEDGTIKASKIITGELVVGANVGLGTAQDAQGVTTIIGGVVTTDYIKALGLEVGDHIIMGPNARILWQQVDDIPNDLAYQDDIPTMPSYIKSTYIDSARIESPLIIGG
ncbi:MAG: phage tail protein, partial [Oscillospiraceae bacterium]|nr:phage tail protein [Oscillospiraceae bacterium]